MKWRENGERDLACGEESRAGGLEMLGDRERVVLSVANLLIFSFIYLFIFVFFFF